MSLTHKIDLECVDVCNRQQTNQEKNQCSDYLEKENFLYHMMKISSVLFDFLNKISCIWQKYVLSVITAIEDWMPVSIWARKSWLYLKMCSQKILLVEMSIDYLRFTNEILCLMER